MSTPIGYLMLARKFFDHEMWSEKREFSRAEAWIDMLQDASFKDGKKIIKGKLVHLKRGQLLASNRYLQARWGWKSLSKVQNFLKLLQENEMIEVENVAVTSRITICKYDDYNSLEVRQRSDKGQTKVRQRSDKGQTKVKIEESKKVIREEGKNTTSKANVEMGKGDPGNLKESVRSDDMFRERTRMKYNLSESDFDLLLDEFIADKSALGNLTHKNAKDVREHFFYWIPKRPRSPATPSPTKKHPSLEVINPSKYDKYRTQ